MDEMRTFAMDDPVARASIGQSVCLTAHTHSPDEATSMRPLLCYCIWLSLSFRANCISCTTERHRSTTRDLSFIIRKKYCNFCEMLKIRKTIVEWVRLSSAIVLCATYNLQNGLFTTRLDLPLGWQGGSLGPPILGASFSGPRSTSFTVTVLKLMPFNVVSL